MLDLILASDRGGRWRTRVPERRRERMRGLLGRSGLAADEALLLPDCHSVHTVGMRFAIRVAFLDGDLRVLAVRDAPPGRLLVRRRRAESVLELPAGADVRLGDRFVAIHGPGRPEDRRYTLAAAPGDMRSRRAPIV